MRGFSATVTSEERLEGKAATRPVGTGGRGIPGPASAKCKGAGRSRPAGREMKGVDETPRWLGSPLRREAGLVAAWDPPPPPQPWEEERLRFPRGLLCPCERPVPTPRRTVTFSRATAAARTAHTAEGDLDSHLPPKPPTAHP